MISQTVEYALRAIVTIAQANGVPCTSQNIAESTQVPAPYLSKLMQRLVRSDLVQSKRGLHGGFVLVKPPTELTVWDVVDSVDPIKRIEKCPLDLKTHQGGLCPLHQRLDNALSLVEEAYRATFVSELLAEPGRSTPLCESNPVVSIDLPPSSNEKTTRKRKTQSAKKKTRRKQK